MDLLLLGIGKDFEGMEKIYVDDFFFQLPSYIY